MVLPTQAEADYFVNPYGTTSIALSTYITPALVPVDPGMLMLFSASITSDNATDTGTQAKRATVLDLTQPPFVASTHNAPLGKGQLLGVKLPFSLQVQSTSADDAAAGIGVRTISVDYNDVLGNPHTLGLTLKGKTAVISTEGNVWQVTGVTFATTGTFQTSRGVLIFSSVPVVSGPPDLPTVGSVQIVGSCLEGFFNNVPYTSSSEWGRPFAQLLTGGLQKAVGPVITKPVLIT